MVLDSGSAMILGEYFLYGILWGLLKLVVFTFVGCIILTVAMKILIILIGLLRTLELKVIEGV